MTDRLALPNQPQSGTAPVYLLSGPPGVGKTSVGIALAQRFPFGLHLPLDDLREWVVSGIAHPVPIWTEETTRQFTLARTAAAQTARLYAEAGFAVAIDDVLFPQPVNDIFLPHLTGLTVHKILLLPDVDTILMRNQTRTSKPFDTAFLNDTIRHLHAEMTITDFRSAGWRILNTASLTLEQTVDTILAHSNAADPREGVRC